MLASVAVLAVASCQKEMANEPEASFDVFTVTASIGTDTKTVLDDTAEGNKIYWTPGDKISLFDTENEEVQFSTAITSNSTTASFTNDAIFKVPASLVAAYPYRGAYTFDGTTVNNFRIGTPQKAVAGSYDPEFAGAIGLPKEPGSTSLQFRNLHCLVKFTIGGDVAPSTITLHGNGMRSIAGLYHYNTSNGEITQGGGKKDIELQGTFEVGKTYYIAVIPGIVGNGLSLLFDGIVVKNTGETKTLEPNKIYNLGTVEKPAVQINATLVKAFQSHNQTSFMTELGGSEQTNRNIGLDNNYVYIAETQGSPVLWKIALTDGAASKLPTTTVDGTATHALACPRIIPNNDASINNGNDVLVACSMGMSGQDTFLYVYDKGIENNPTKLSLNTAWMARRIGDKFTYMSGNNGVTTLFMKDYNTGALLTFNLTMKDGAVSCTEATSRTYLFANDESGAGAFYLYPGASSYAEGMYTSTDKGSYVVKKDDVITEGKSTYVAQWDDLTTFKGCHGFNFFKVGGQNYIAYTKYSNQTLYVIKGAANAAGVKAALEANQIVWSWKIAADDNGCYSNHSGADCAVSVIDDNNVYVAGNIQNVGVVVYKLSAE